jgi:hypothetical protein
MEIITLTRQKDYMIFFRALKIYVDSEFVDYFEPNEKVKKINIKVGSKIKVKVDWCSSNTITIPEKSIENQVENNIYRISSQIHNSLFIIIFGCFIIGNLLQIFYSFNPHMYLALISPISIIVGWQIFGRNNYLRLTKINKSNLY